jgi:hypothetical protein
MTHRIIDRAGLEWTQDCQGKEDFDGPILRVSSRIYPRGGSSDVWEFRGGVLVGKSTTIDPSRQHIRPSGVSHILFGGRDIAKKDFEAETTEELKQQIEAWAETVLGIIGQAIADRQPL